MFKKSFKVKIILPTVIILSALVIALNIFLTLRFTSLTGYLINEKMESNINTLNYYLEDCETSSRTAAVSIPFQPGVINAMKEKNTEELLRLITSMQGMYRINYCTVTDSEGTVLARTHEPDKFGDSVLKQQNIWNALDGKVLSNFGSESEAKVSVCTGAPVYDNDGKLLGVVSAGVRFDSDSEVEKLKELFHSEVTVFLDDMRVATTITKDGQSIVGTTLDPKIADIVINHRQEYTGTADILGERYTTYYKPLINARDEVFAVFFLGMSEAEMRVATTSAIRDGIILGLFVLLVSVMLIYFFMSSVSKPIVMLSDNMSHIANGNLKIDINVKSEDEVGHLSKSLQRIASILYKLLDDINIMISEHKKGNTDYDFKTEEFQGDFRILAESVSELASFGMRDQLTGLPNRRSFDNRINWEWLRAEREGSPIGVLMIDVDKFKSYNDAFGHQQGDVALQSVAKAIKQSLKRSIDFAARWGGEEFIVLLPITDLSGALTVAENIRRTVENLIIKSNDKEGEKATVSIGVNVQIPTPNTTISSFVASADGALYKAKETGRNRVCHYKN